MKTKKIPIWREGIAINLVSNGVSFLVGCAVAYLKHQGSEWVSPLMFGALAWFITMGIWVVARVFRSIPAPQVKVTDQNLPGILREWLDDIGLKVQTGKDELAHFVFIVTTDGGRVISISRLKASSEYLMFRANFREDEQTKAFSHFTDEEKAEARLTLELELTRAVMGFNAPDILANFTIFKQIPISPSLSIEEVSGTLWKVEAALASVFYAGARLLVRKKRGTLLLADEVTAALP
jgi:hypothetical protein